MPNLRGATRRQRLPIHLILCLSCLAGASHAAKGHDPPLDPAQARADPKDAILWYDARLLGVEGQGWSETRSPFDRLPARAEAAVPATLWEVSRYSAGLSVRFITDAQTVHARWTLTSARLALPHMPATGASGVDLYVRQGGRWRWIGAGWLAGRGAQQQSRLVEGLPPGEHEFLLYLPLYNGVSALDLGIGPGHVLRRAGPGPAGRQKPIVFYGTSITQGGCASRPGMAYPAILGRRLDRPIINLGLAGIGRMEPEMARLLAELDPAIYVIECLPNMNAQEVEQRAGPLLRALREARPETPILLLEDPTYGNAFLLPAVRQRSLDRRAALRRVYDGLIRAGVRHLHYLPGERLYGDDGEATVDGVHPSDLGFQRLADGFQPALEALLRGARRQR